MKDLCNECRYFDTEDESEDGVCTLQLDEDEYARLFSNPSSGDTCKFFAPDIGEYGIVRKQN